MKAFRREILDEIPLRHDWHRFFIVLAYARGYTVTEIDIELFPRHAGEAKYTGRGRILVGVGDLLVVWFYLKFSEKPMQFFGGTGLALIVLGMLVGLVTVVLRIGGLDAAFRIPATADPRAAAGDGRLHALRLRLHRRDGRDRADRGGRAAEALAAEVMARGRRPGRPPIALGFSHRRERSSRWRTKRATSSGYPRPLHPPSAEKIMKLRFLIGLVTVQVAAACSIPFVGGGDSKADCDQIAARAIQSSSPAAARDLAAEATECYARLAS